MDMLINGTLCKNVKRTLGNEIALKICDALIILQNMPTFPPIVLGGDILREDMSYTLDNWYFLPRGDLLQNENALLSCEYAVGFLNSYIAMNGHDYYVVLVIQQT